MVWKLVGSCLWSPVLGLDVPLTEPGLICVYFPGFPRWVFPEAPASQWLVPVPSKAGVPGQAGQNALDRDVCSLSSTYL